ncbi:GatB/YqeY domain-containing protein [Mesorhizobium sp. KR9-304]|uniref:GatB/YqeY domain-containing protein n=1 Tax=Mesorhizobium sp. KR9-304 TaxID=3156614 RepID=UPI0032B4CDC8
MRARISDALKTALKAGDKQRATTLRMVNAAIQDRDIANRGTGKGPAGDEEVLQILTKMVKQRQESAKAFEDGKRPELAAQENAEIAIIADFLPSQMEEGEAKAAIGEAIRETGATGPRDMGKVMAELKAKYAGRMDFGKASGWVKQLLG